MNTAPTPRLGPASIPEPTIPAPVGVGAIPAAAAPEQPAPAPDGAPGELSERCPYCGDPLRPGALKCRQCQSVLRVDLSTNTRGGAAYPYRDIRLDLRLYRLLQLAVVVFSVGGAISLMAFGYDLWSARTETQRNAEAVRGVRTEVETVLAEIKSKVAAADLQAAALQAERDLMDEDLARAEERFAASLQRLSDSVNTRVTEMARRTARAAAAEGASNLSLLRPVSRNAALPTTSFGDSIRFEWSFPGTRIGTDGFQLQVSASPAFDHVLVDHRAYRDSFELDNAPGDAGRRPFTGTLYWRVRLVTAEEGGGERFGPWSPAAVFSAYGSALDRIRTTGKVRIGTSAFNGAPSDSIYMQGDGENRRVAGLDHDIIEAVFAYLVRDRQLPPVTLEFVNFEWSEMFEALADDRVDLIISGITSTEARETLYKIDFAAPYYQTPLAAVWRKDSGIRSAEDLAGRTIIAIAGQRGSHLARLLTTPDRLSTPGSTNYVALFSELLKERNRGAAAVMDLPMTRMADDPRFRDAFVVTPLTRDSLPAAAAEKWAEENNGSLLESWAFAASADDYAFTSMLNSAVRRLREDGAFDGIVARHGFPPSYSE